MANKPQYELPLIAHEAAGEIIQQRAKDGYIDATAMCAGLRGKVGVVLEDSAGGRSAWSCYCPEIE